MTGPFQYKGPTSPDTRTDHVVPGLNTDSPFGSSHKKLLPVQKTESAQVVPTNRKVNKLGREKRGSPPQVAGGKEVPAVVVAVVVTACVVVAGNWVVVVCGRGLVMLVVVSGAVEVEVVLGELVLLVVVVSGTVEVEVVLVELVVVSGLVTVLLPVMSSETVNCTENAAR